MKDKDSMIMWLNNLKTDIEQRQYQGLRHYVEILDVITKHLESTELSKEHGRLIDADKLLQELFTVDEEEWTTPEIRTILENAPTIVAPTERVGITTNMADSLHQEIRCEVLCTNPMKSDRGCDGGCQYDTKLLKRIDEVIEKVIVDSPKERTGEG